MKFKIKLSIALVMSLMLVACGGGGSTPPKAKVFKLIKEEVIFDSGSSIKVIVNTYDDKGVLVRQDRDFDGNGELDGREEYYTYTYDEEGRLLIREKHAPAGDVLVSEEFDIHGNRVSISNDTDRDGEFDYFRDYINTYDDAGLLLKLEYPGIVVSYTYEGETVIESIDALDLDGEINRVARTTYNEYGDVVEYQSDHDADGDNEIAYTRAYTYIFDKENNIIKKEEDLNNDGSVNRVTTYTWEEFK